MTEEQIRELTEKYGNAEKALLKDNPSLDVLYEFSNQRAGIIDWLDIPKKSRILFIGRPVTAIRKLFDEKKTDVICPDGSASGSYDYIISIGTLHLLSKEKIESLFGLLTEGGSFIAACDNKYGAKYLNGDEPDECALTRNSIEKLLGDKLTWYYPMPDYRLPECIFSDDYLPKKGQLSRHIDAYKDSEYKLRDIGTIYDELCEDGEFARHANSFLVIKKHE